MNISFFKLLKVSTGVLQVLGNGNEFFVPYKNIEQYYEINALLDTLCGTPVSAVFKTTSEPGVYTLDIGLYTFTCEGQAETACVYRLLSVVKRENKKQRKAGKNK